jgi:hypothetical protein
MDKYGYRGRSATLAAAAVLLSLAALPAWAQGPGGSYMESCTNVRAFGDRIIADCRRMDGAWNRTALHDADSCVGDIGNMNGHLTCNRGRRDFTARQRGWEGYGSSRAPYRDYYGR